MKKLRGLSLIVLLALVMSSCYTMTHTVGNGAQTGVSVEKKQWYALWGLVPINEVDSKAMASGATDYTITTKHKFVDFVISYFTSIVTISTKTVKVQK